MNQGETPRNKPFRVKKLSYIVNQFYKDKLNEEQKECYSLIDEKTLTIITGKAGSGKTLIACYSALKDLASKKIDRIVITRPTISTEDNGFLPGDIKDKLDPWMSPIYGNIQTITGPDICDQLVSEKLIEIVPLTYMRGRTFVNNTIIVDEAQNMTHEQLLMTITRIGIHSKMIICGDTSQIDFKKKETSGLLFLSSINDEEIGSFKLLENHRHPIVDKILNIYENEYSSSGMNKVLELRNNGSY